MTDPISRRRWLQLAGSGSTLGLIGLLSLSSGCASGPRSVRIELRSWGQWPAERQPGRCRFERLPSQQAQPAQQQLLEDALRPALQAAGFVLVDAPPADRPPAPDAAPTAAPTVAPTAAPSAAPTAAASTAAPHPTAGSAADDAPELLVQAGARLLRSHAAPWDDPLWWPGGWHARMPGWRGPRPAHWGWGPTGGLGWDWPPPPGPVRVQHEVAVLLRERRDGQPLYEARASVDGWASSGQGLADTPADAALLRALYRAALQDFPAARPEPHRVSVTL